MTIEQLLAEPGFHNWALRHNEQDIAYWETWRAENPELADRMEEARMLLTGLEFAKTPAPDSEKTLRWNALQQQIHQPAPTQLRSNRRAWLAVAASMALLLCVGWWMFSGATEIALETVRTSFAEIRTVRLPDGSNVTLNANSELQYAKSWKPGQIRQVLLSGEAFFEVQHGGSNERFLVQLGQAEVEVLGTSFNVHARHQAPVVSLVAGKTKVRLAESAVEKILSPGETAYLNLSEKQVRVLTGETALQTSWKDHKWIFNNTQLEQVLQRIEDEFGLKALGVAPDLLKKRVSGQISTRDKAVLFKALEVLLDVEISESDQKISILKREN